MKKIGIMTFNNTINYGALFQAFSLQKFLINNNYIVENINYINDSILRQESAYISQFSLKNIIKKIVIKNGFKRKKNKFILFEKKYIKLSSPYNCNTIKDIGDSYDIFLAGSDQIWNTNLTNNDLNYFFSFLPNNKKIMSYASSFGNNVDKIICEEEIGQQLKRFSAISVRENSGRNYIKSKFNLNCFCSLDPTFLLKKDDWDKIIPNGRPIREKYILVYFPNNKKKVFSFVKKLKKYTKLPVIYLSISPKIQLGVKTIYDASPEEFLRWIYYAEYIITGSFHGTAFSINFNKNFFYESSEKESRIGNLVNKFDLISRNIDNGINLKPIDYTKINLKLEHERNLSSQWLLDNIENL